MELTYQDAIDYLRKCAGELIGTSIMSAEDTILNPLRNETSKYLEYSAKILEQNRLAND